MEQRFPYPVFRPIPVRLSEQEWMKYLCEPSRLRYQINWSIGGATALLCYLKVLCPAGYGTAINVQNHCDYSAKVTQLMGMYTMGILTVNWWSCSNVGKPGGYQFQLLADYQQ